MYNMDTHKVKEVIAAFLKGGNGMTKEKDRDIVFDVIESIGIIKAFPNGWTKELNMVSWNGNEAKYDIRDWDANHERMSRGITLKADEMETIVNLLKDRVF